jgi:ribonucleoside-diphosphate reductase alpha chain
LFSIQPTGNTGILANVVSGGLEPIFLIEYIRTVICPHVPDEIKGKCPKYWEGEFKENEFFKLKKEGTDDILVSNIGGIVYKIDKNRGLTKEVLCEDYAVHILKEMGRWNPTADYVVTTTQLTPDEHIKDMMGWAKYIDSAISKTLNLPNDFPYDKFKDIYLDCYKTGFIKGFTTYRDGTMTTVLKSVDKKEENVSKIAKTVAPKRPKTLPCEVFHLTQSGERYYVVVGLMDGDPYEIFTGPNKDETGDPVVPKSIKIGELMKKSRGAYILKNSEKDFSCALTNGHSDSNADALTRMISTSLRHGVDISFVVHQLEKTEGDLFCFSKILARTLKKYIKEGTEVVGETIDGCETPNKCKIVREEGCKKCLTCGSSKCG